MSLLRTQLGTTGLRNGTVRGRAAVALQSNGAVPLAPLVSLRILPSTDMEQQDRTAADLTATQLRKADLRG